MSLRGYDEAIPIQSWCRHCGGKLSARNVKRASGRYEVEYSHTASSALLCPPSTSAAPHDGFKAEGELRKAIEEAS